VSHIASTLDPGNMATCCAESVGGVDILCIENGCNATGFYRLDLR